LFSIIAVPQVPPLFWRGCLLQLDLGRGRNGEETGKEGKRTEIKRDEKETGFFYRSLFPRP